MSNSTPVNEGSASYQYEPLTSNSGEIRLVKITGLQHDAETDSIVLELDILHTPLNQATRYLAISYAWGNPARTHKLLVNGTALFVPENTFQTLYTVYHALPSLVAELRGRSHQVNLWIDAVCLNQSDLKEKDEQVRRMGQIYSQATGTIGYIGRPPKGKNPFDGFRTLLWMGNDVGLDMPDNVPVDAAKAWCRQSSRDPDQFEEEVGPIAAFAEAYADLFASDWFIRCWVVQEMALSREITCLYGHGSDFAVMGLNVMVTLLNRSRNLENLKHFTTILSAMKTDAEASWGRNQKYFQVDAWSRIRDSLDQSGGLTLLELLEWTRFGKTTDPRDTVYSLMGMMKEQDRSAVRVDYSDYTAPNLFLDIAVHCLTGPPDGGHKVLGWAGLEPTCNLAGLPSWAPDWSTPNQFPMLADGSFGASGSLRHPVTVLDGGRTISARGIPVDAITFLTPPMASADDSATPNMVSVLRFGAQLCRRLQSQAIASGSRNADTYRFNHEPWQDVMRRTCCTDRQIYPYRRASLDNRPAFMACLERYGFGADALATVALDEVKGSLGEDETVTNVDHARLTNVDHARLSEAARGFEDGVLFTQRERIFGMTGTQGLIGSFPDFTRAGDIVVVLLGQELPVVLRPLDGAENGFELVGMCYIHGIMDGEWIAHMTDGQGQGSEVFQDFVIH